MSNYTSQILSLGASVFMCIGLIPEKGHAASKATLFRFKSNMPAAGNCEGAAWKAGEALGDLAYASWDGRMKIMWLSLNGNVYQSSLRRKEAWRAKIVEANFGAIHAIITIPQQTLYNTKAYPIGTLEIRSSSTNASHNRIAVSVGEAC